MPPKEFGTSAVSLRSDRVRFGVFEADLRSGELRKHGMRIRLQSLPFKLLSLLLEHPGELVSREELQQRIWDDSTVVDFDHSIGSAVNKVREALGDSAESRDTSKRWPEEDTVLLRRFRLSTTPGWKIQPRKS